MPMSPITASAVKDRAGAGGHTVPEDKIFARYFRSMKILSKVVEIVDSAKVYDNSEEEPWLLFFKNANGGVLLNKEHQKPWIEEYLIKPLKESGKVTITKCALNQEETNEFKLMLYKDRIMHVECK